MKEQLSGKWDARWLLGLAFVTALCAAGCEDDGKSSAGAGCTTDIECKGTRVCSGGECIDRSASIVDGGGSRVDGGSSGSTDVDDPELEAACSEDCKARHAAGCTMNIGSLDQCLGQCLVIDEQSPYCQDELTARYDCLAVGGYACTSGYPQPKATCIPETQAYSLCAQKAPCRGYCERAAGECEPSGEACIAACEQELTSFEDAICGVYYTQLISCWGRDLSCENGNPVSEMCEPALAQVADCVGRRNHECDGFCWAAEKLGCGSTDCVSTCKPKFDDSTCGSYYRNVLDCAYGSYKLEMSCVGGEPTVSSECDAAVQQYTACTQAM